MFPLKRSNSTLKVSKPKVREAHTDLVKFGMGNYYGRAAKNPMGKVRDGSETVGYRPVSKKQLGTVPRSVV